MAHGDGMRTSVLRAFSLVLTMVAVALAAYSMSLPWYQISRTGDINDVPDVTHTAGTFEFYKEFSIWTSPQGYQYLLPYSGPVYGWNDPVGPTMNTETAGVFIWVVLAILFLLSLAGADFLLGLGSGVALLVEACATVAYFAAVIDDHLRESMLFGSIDGFPGHGFTGHDSVWSWGPLDGWYYVLVALVLLVPAVLIGNYALLLDQKSPGQDERLTDERSEGKKQ
jgi:hypothetical protein